MAILLEELLWGLSRCLVVRLVREVLGNFRLWQLESLLVNTYCSFEFPLPFTYCFSFSVRYPFFPTTEFRLWKIGALCTWPWRTRRSTCLTIYRDAQSFRSFRKRKSQLDSNNGLCLGLDSRPYFQQAEQCGRTAIGCSAKQNWQFWKHTVRFSSTTVLNVLVHTKLALHWVMAV